MIALKLKRKQKFGTKCARECHSVYFRPVDMFWICNRQKTLAKFTAYAVKNFEAIKT